MKRKNPYDHGDGDDREEAGVLWTRPKNAEGLRMTLKVHMMSGETFHVFVDPWFTIAEVKNVICQMRGYLQETQQLSIRGRLCVDGHQISRYTNMRITEVNLTLVGTSNSSSSTSNNNTNTVGDGDGNHGYVPGDGNHGLAPEPLPDSDDEATHELLMLLRDQQAAHAAAEEGEDEEGNESEHFCNKSDEDEATGSDEPGDEPDEPDGDDSGDESAASPHPSDGS